MATWIKYAYATAKLRLSHGTKACWRHPHHALVLGGLFIVAAIFSRFVLAAVGFFIIAIAAIRLLSFTRKAHGLEAD